MNQLKGRKRVEKLQNISLDLIDPPPAPVRRAMDEGKMEELKESIKAIGLINPITVQRNGPRYEVIAGARRYVAHSELGKAAIWCRVVDVDSSVSAGIMLHENAVREDVSALEEAEAIDRLMKKANLTAAEVAERIGRSESYVSQRRALLAAPECLQEAVASKGISFAAARELMQITNLADLKSLVGHAVHSGINRAVARQWRMQWQAAQEGRMPEDSTPATASDYSTIPSNPIVRCDVCREGKELADVTIMRVCRDCRKALDDAMS